MNKIIKVEQFRQEYTGEFRINSYTSFEDWQKEKPNIKIIDTKIIQKEIINYETHLVVTYEELEELKKHE